MASVQEWLATANAVVPRLAPGELRELMSRPDVVIVDVRDAPEVRSPENLRGQAYLPRHARISRRPATPYYDPVLQKDRTVVLYCAFGRTFRARREDAARHGLPLGLQRRRIKDLAAAGIETEPVND